MSKFEEASTHDVVARAYYTSYRVGHVSLGEAMDGCIGQLVEDKKRLVAECVRLMSLLPPNVTLEDLKDAEKEGP